MGFACVTCDRTIRRAELPRWESVAVDSGWRVAHAWSALRGWLVVLPLRHVERLSELTVEEADALGPLLRDVSAALEDVLGCAKTYVLLFAEKEGFSHLHFHLVPRAPDMEPELRGPAVMAYLNRPDADLVPEPERDRIADAVAVRLGRPR